MAPPSVTADEQFPIEVHVYSQFATSGTVTLRKGSETLESKTVQLEQGTQPNRVQHPREGRNQYCDVSKRACNAKEDSFDANNTFRQPVVVNGRPRILYVESHEASAQYLRRALESEGLIVDVIAPEALPQAVSQLDAL